ncbi:MAG: TonB family protein [Acidobacteriaceae bacterium]|nr:TonB family protein [Acidobacteriaceae bacterium]
MSRGAIRRWFAGAAVLALMGVVVLLPVPGRAQQDELTRKVKTKVAPVYPELAKRMSISGVVKVQVVVAQNGTVKSTKIVGGHPLLVNAATDAIKKWKFEPAGEETIGIVEFKFDPNVATQ